MNHPVHTNDDMIRIVEEIIFIAAGFLAILGIVLLAAALGVKL